MAGNVIKEFLVSLGFQVDKAGQQNFVNGIGKASLAVAGLGAATVAAAGAITAFVNSQAKELSALGNLSNRINTTAEDIERFGYIASMTGSSVDAAKSSLESMSNVMGQAATGVGRGAKYFEKFGLEVRKSNGEVKSTTEMMGEIGAYIKDMSRPEQMSILNRLGLDPSMLRLLTEDTVALAAEFDNIDNILDINKDTAIKYSKALLASQKRIAHIFKELKEAIAVKLMPKLTKAFEIFRRSLLENLPKIMNTITPILSGLLSIADGVLRMGMRVFEILSKVIDWFLKVNEATNGWVIGIGAAIAAWKYLNASFLLTPLGAILALGAALLLLYDDYMTFKEGGDSLINWQNWTAEIDKVIEYFKLLWSWLDVFVSGVINLFIALFQLVTGDVDGMAETIGFQFEKIKAFLSDLLAFFGVTFADINAIIDAALGSIGKFLDKFTSFQGIKGMLDSVFGVGGSGSALYRPDISPATAAASGGRAGATVNQNITNNIQSTDPQAAGRAVVRESNKGIQDLARNTAAVAY